MFYLIAISLCLWPTKADNTPMPKYALPVTFVLDALTFGAGYAVALL